MERTQRIIELRHMFLQLAEILLDELQRGKPLSELKDIKSVMERINSELSKLEKERQEHNPILR